MSPRNLPQQTVRDAIAPESTASLRTDLTAGRTPDLRRRRGIVGLSFVGLAAMGAVTLLQTGLVRHLPDPPGGWFDSDAANLSDDAYEPGIPDGTLAVRSLATNVPLAATGGRHRARDRPWLPLAAAAKAAVGAVGAGTYLSKMVRGKQPWCPYCLTGAAANFGILALALPEAVRAGRQVARALREWWSG